MVLMQITGGFSRQVCLLPKKRIAQPWSIASLKEVALAQSLKILEAERREAKIFRPR